MARVTTSQAIQKLKQSETPWLLVLVGLPGSGKSTFVQACKAGGLEFDVLSIDDVLDEYAAERGLTYSEAHKQGFKHAKATMRSRSNEARLHRRNVIYDQTNVGSKSRRTKLVEFIQSKYLCISLSFDVPVAELQERISKRALATGKVIPKHVFEDMLQNSTPPSKAEGFSQLWELTQA